MSILSNKRSYIYSQWSYTVSHDRIFKQDRIIHMAHVTWPYTLPLKLGDPIQLVSHKQSNAEQSNAYFSGLNESNFTDI